VCCVKYSTETWNYQSVGGKKMQYGIGEQTVRDLEKQKNH
jgi:hypothetical protein